MRASLPAGLTLALLGLWLLRLARADDGVWGRATFNWPVPWPQMQPGTQRLLRAAAGAVGLAATLGGAAWAVWG